MPDGTSDAVDAATLTGPTAAWLEARADELGVTEEELLARLVDAFRTAEDSDADVSTAGTLDDIDDRLVEVEGELADVEDEFDEKIADVRERVIQVKREADGKADRDHDHADLAEKTRAAAEAVRQLESDHEALAEDVQTLSERVDAGFENFEEVLSYLRDETDDLNRKVTKAAATVLSMRESVAALAGAEARRERVERLQTAANQAGVRVADCGECEQEVTVSLLTEPSCPFCSAAFEDVESNSGWFGSHTLVTGEPPALKAADSLLDEDDESWLDDDAALAEMVEADGDDADGDAANETDLTEAFEND
jgi:chromosome segregation ATPase